MTKKKSFARKQPVYSKIKDPKKPQWMRVIHFTTVILLLIFVLFMIGVIMLRYYRELSNHH